MTEQHTIQETDKQPESCYSIESSAEPVDSSSWLTEYNELFYNNMDDYWEPPISPAGLAQIARANAYHCSALIARSNYVASRFISGGNMRKREVLAQSRDHFTFGHGAFLKIRDYFKRPIGLAHISSMYLRRRKNGEWVYLQRMVITRFITITILSGCHNTTRSNRFMAYRII